MIGCDIIKISRFSKNLEKFRNKILTAEEKKEFDKTSNKLEYISGRWAAKEAIYKATGIRNPSIINDSNRKPIVLNYPDVKVSISHEKKYAIAIAFLT